MTDGPKLAGTAFAYIRVSDPRAAEDGHSLEAQEATLARYCGYRGWPFDPRKQAFVDAGVSAFKKEFRTREAGGALCRRLVRGDVVVVTMLDRAFRRTVDAIRQVERWGREGVGLVVLNMAGTTVDTSSAGGVMFLTIMAAFAEHSSRVQSERMKYMHAAIKAKGGCSGRPPLGFQYLRRKDGSLALVRDDATRAVMGLMHDLWKSGLTVDQVRQEIVYRRKLSLARCMGAGPRKTPVVLDNQSIIHRWIAAEAALRDREAQPAPAPEEPA